MDATVDVGAAAVGRTRDDFACASIDYWPREKCNFCEGTKLHPVKGNKCCPWAGASLLDMPLALLRPAVVALAEAGGDRPLTLRLGGSLQDIVRYEGDAPSGACGRLVEDPTRRLGFSGGCLTRARFAELLGFCASNRCRFLLGINALAGRRRALNGSKCERVFRRLRESEAGGRLARVRGRTLLPAG